MKALKREGNKKVNYNNKTPTFVVYAYTKKQGGNNGCGVIECVNRSIFTDEELEITTTQTQSQHIGKRGVVWEKFSTLTEMNAFIEKNVKLIEQRQNDAPLKMSRTELFEKLKEQGIDTSKIII